MTSKLFYILIISFKSILTKKKTVDNLFTQNGILNTKELSNENHTPSPQLQTLQNPNGNCDNDHRNSEE
jgi:hypothetical protein